jgi:hypothetical protein
VFGREEGRLESICKNCTLCTQGVFCNSVLFDSYHNSDCFSVEHYLVFRRVCTVAKCDY